MTELFINKYIEARPYKTKDNSIVRELMHPAHGQAQNQSLAEAIVQPGASTLRHKHKLAEEIYHITSGCGEMSLDDKSFPVFKGDTIIIRPGTVHHLSNSGTEALTVLCCCSPAYDHDDTILILDTTE